MSLIDPFLHTNSFDFCKFVFHSTNRHAFLYYLEDRWYRLRFSGGRLFTVNNILQRSDYSCLAHAKQKQDCVDTWKRKLRVQCI